NKQRERISLESSFVILWLNCVGLRFGIKSHYIIRSCEMPLMGKLTVLIPTFNEEQNLAGCIASLNDLPAEIVVVDSFSTDETMNIAKKMKVSILQRVFDDYASQKNWALEQIQSDWILILDSDERLTEALRKEIRLLLQSEPPYHAYSILRNA